MRQYGQLMDPRAAERADIFEREVEAMAAKNIAENGTSVDVARDNAAIVLAGEIGKKSAITIG